MSIAKQIEDIIEPALLEKGFGIVRLQLQGSSSKVLQLMIERLDGTPVAIDDCVAASHMVSALLDVHDPIPGSYTLEVGSAGLDRPLVKLSDFERFVGSTVKIDLSMPQEGMRRFRGRLLRVEAGKIFIEYPSSSEPDKFDIAELAFSDIQKAKIIPDEEPPKPLKGRK